ncbi:hypothetical protein CDAR_173261 [Caerostris darwini]|uniref:Uncharacterized protein n=1 Tax=Caerostris darwini TaxID=1538125 RepID=A0AAV4WI20_9ARAC|nr:hypothetical protein CDAR_173261 [Caerostris darwini]
MPRTIIVPNKHLSRSLANYRGEKFPKGIPTLLITFQIDGPTPLQKGVWILLILVALNFFSSTSHPFTSVLPVLHPVLLFMETSNASIEQEIRSDIHPLRPPRWNLGELWVETNDPIFHFVISSRSEIDRGF